MSCWAGEVEAWCASLVAAGRSRETVALRRYQIGRLGVELGVSSPWEVTTADFIAWSAGREWSRDTRRAWRAACRTFWAWGVATGRVGSSPAAGLPSVRPEVPCPRPASDLAYLRACQHSP